jgi:group I intron endonuclease
MSKKLRKGSIYKITSPSRKVYIGLTFNIYSRKSHYKNLFCKSQTKIYLSLLKYGWEQHTFEVIEVIDECNEITLYEREIYWKQYYLNLVDNKMSMVLFCKTHDGAVDLEKAGNTNKNGKNNPMYGKEHSNETKEKISKANKGLKRSEEDKLKMKEQNGGLNNPMYGKKHNEESVNKIKAKATGRFVSDDTKKKLSENGKGEKNNMYGRKGELSPKYGTNQNEATKQKIGEGNRIAAKERFEKLPYKNLITLINAINKC